MIGTPPLAGVGLVEGEWECGVGSFGLGLRILVMFSYLSNKEAISEIKYICSLEIQ